MHWSGRIYIRVAPFQMLLDIQRTIYLFFHILVYCSLWTHWNFPQKWPLELNIKYDLLHAPLLIDSHHLSIWYGSLEQTTFYTKSRMHNHQVYASCISFETVMLWCTICKENCLVLWGSRRWNSGTIWEVILSSICALYSLLSICGGSILHRWRKNQFRVNLPLRCSARLVRSRITIGRPRLYATLALYLAPLCERTPGTFQTFGPSRGHRQPHQ